MADDQNSKVHFLSGLPTEALEKNEESGAFNALLEQLKNNDKGKDKAPRIALTEDPMTTQNWAGVYRTKYDLVPDVLIKKIRIQNSLVANIQRLRSNNLSMFGRIKKDRFDIGIQTKVKSAFEGHIKPDQMIKIRERIEKFERLLTTCGKNDIYREDEKLSFSQFVYLQTGDGITLGRFATEFIYEDIGGGKKRFHSFRPVDASTIFRTVRDGATSQAIRESGLRLIEQISDVKFDKERFKEDDYAYVQAINGFPRQAFTSDEMSVWNLYPSNDIDHNGYPITPIDTAIGAITTYLNIETYNRLYFQNGRAAKGMLVIQSDQIDQKTLNMLRQEFVASINNASNAFRVPVMGVSKDDSVQWTPMVSSTGDGEFAFLYENVTRSILTAFMVSPDEMPGLGHLSKGTNQKALCLDLNSRVITTLGQYSIQELLDDKDEAYFHIWTGTKWEKARAFYSDEKRRMRVKTNNGAALITSPDHKFMVIGSDGEPTWKTRSELTTEDWILINRISPQNNNLPKLNGHEVNEEIAELLGWLVGDGCFSVRKQKNTGNMKQGACTWYYHPTKERDIWEKHAKLMKKYNLNVHQKEIILDEEDVEKRIQYCHGAKSASKVQLKNYISSNEFARFLLSIGITPSSEGKQIPNFMYSAPDIVKGAFLKAFFSADGTLNKGRPVIIIHDDRLREQTKQLLLSMGIRTQLSEGKIKSHPNPNKRKKGAYCLRVKDKFVFFEKVGFLQNHKQPDSTIFNGVARWEKLPKQTLYKYINKVLEIDNKKQTLSKQDRNNLYTVLSETAERNISADKIKKLMKEVGVEIPAWMDNFYAEKIVELTDLEEYSEMCDIEVFDDTHAFVANGMVVHNSESNNSYKLIAERDGGLRPLILAMESFINEKLFPIIDPELAQICVVGLTGLDAQSREEEAIRLQQEMPIHMTYNQVLQDVDKKPIPDRLGGDFPFSERAQIVMDKYITTAELLFNFMKDPNAMSDPTLKYRRDPFWLNYIQLMMQANPGAAKAYFATKPFTLDILKLNVNDFLEQDGE